MPDYDVNRDAGGFFRSARIPGNGDLPSEFNGAEIILTVEEPVVKKAKVSVVVKVTTEATGRTEE